MLWFAPAKVSRLNFSTESLNAGAGSDTVITKQHCHYCLIQCAPTSCDSIQLMDLFSMRCLLQTRAMPVQSCAALYWTLPVYHLNPALSDHKHNLQSTLRHKLRKKIMVSQEVSAREWKWVREKLDDHLCADYLTCLEWHKLHSDYVLSNPNTMPSERLSVSKQTDYIVSCWCSTLDRRWRMDIGHNVDAWWLSLCNIMQEWDFWRSHLVMQ